MTLDKLFNLFLLLLTLSIGIICIRAPIKAASIIVWWAKLVSNGSISDPKAREAVYLMENDKDEYARKFDTQLQIIQRTGFVVILISVIGSCLIIFGK